MTENNRKARLAGFLYLLLVVTGILNLIYLPSQFIVWDDAAQTVEKIRNSESLFRWAIAIGIVSYLAFLFLALALYRLLSQVNKTYAWLMVLFVLVSIPVSFMNMLHKIDVLTLIGNADLVSALDPAEIQFQVMYHLRAHNNGIQLSQIFWGLWLLPFGYLVYKSGFLPRILGILLMAGCAGYLIQFFGPFLWAGYRGSLLHTLAGIPASIGELGICLWLLIAGARTIRLGGKRI